MKSAHYAAIAFCIAGCLYGQGQASNPSGAAKAAGPQGTVERINRTFAVGQM